MSPSLLVVWIVFVLGLLMTTGLVVVVVAARRRAEPDGRLTSGETPSESAAYADLLRGIIDSTRETTLTAQLPTDPQQRREVLQQLREAVQRAAGGSDPGAMPPPSPSP